MFYSTYHQDHQFEVVIGCSPTALLESFPVSFNFLLPQTWHNIFEVFIGAVTGCIVEGSAHERDKAWQGGIFIGRITIALLRHNEVVFSTIKALIIFKPAKKPVVHTASKKTVYFSLPTERELRL